MLQNKIKSLIKKKRGGDTGQASHRVSRKKWTLKYNVEMCLKIDVVLLHILKKSSYFTFENLKNNFGELVKSVTHDFYLCL